jgi:hypothetical protein
VSAGFTRKRQGACRIAGNKSPGNARRGGGVKGGAAAEGAVSRASARGGGGPSVAESCERASLFTIDASTPQASTTSTTRSRYTRIAKTLLVNTRKGSAVIAKIAGIESTAKMTSVAQRLSHRDDVGLAVEDAKVERQHRKHEHNESYPDPDHAYRWEPCDSVHAPPRANSQAHGLVRGHAPETVHTRESQQSFITCEYQP